MSCCTALLTQLTNVQFYPLMRELGIYLDLIACSFVLLVKLLPFRNSASLTVAIAAASRLAAALGSGLVGFSMLRELLISRMLFADVQLYMPLSLKAVVGPDRTSESQDAAHRTVIEFGKQRR